jgi:hypothetical protein
VIFTDIAVSIGVGQGEVLGIVGFLQTVLAVVAPLIFQTLYSFSVKWYGGFVFCATGFVTFLGFCFTWRHGARFSAEIYTRGCHWILRLFT